MTLYPQILCFTNFQQVSSDFHVEWKIWLCFSKGTDLFLPATWSPESGSAEALTVIKQPLLCVNLQRVSHVKRSLQAIQYLQLGALVLVTCRLGLLFRLSLIFPVNGILILCQSQFFCPMNSLLWYLNFCCPGQRVHIQFSLEFEFQSEFWPCHWCYI